MPPRAHNLISYGFALLVFVAVVGLRARSASAALQPVALLAGFMWCFHFARRAAESAWVHRYSKPSVPIADVATEYVYYWGFAAWNAVSLTAESYRGPAPWFVVLGAVVFATAEWGNARAHRMLRDLRHPGARTRALPRGFLFEHVSCPHYLFEILSWAGFALLTQTWSAAAFLLVGSGILGAWARARHLAYRKEFDGLQGRELYPVSRRALFPGLF